MMLLDFLPLVIIFITSAKAVLDSALLKSSITIPTPSIGVSTTSDGRLFLLYARYIDRSTGPLLVELKDNTSIPYPNQLWNSYSKGKDPATHFVKLNSQRIGPDGALWIVDQGSPDFEQPVILPGGPKIIRVDITTNKVSRVYPMGNVSERTSYLNDIRFNPTTRKAYITDSGTPPAIIVLDLDSGRAERVLEAEESTSARMPVSVEGSMLRDLNGKLVYVHADQLEVSPDGRWLYYQPCSGGMSRIRTSLLDSAFYNSSLRHELGTYVEPFALTASTAGTAIDEQGNIYVSDTDRRAITKVTPSGSITTVVQDDRLSWVDAMWIDDRGQLWLPAAQLSRGPLFNNGTNRIDYPIHVYTMDLGIEPPRIDHA